MGQGQTLLRLSCQPPVVLIPFPTATLEDDSGRTFRATGGSSDRGECRVEFPPVPPGPSRLALAGEGIRVALRGQWELPLVPGVSREVKLEPGS